VIYKKLLSVIALALMLTLCLMVTACKNGSDIAPVQEEESPVPETAQGNEDTTTPQAEKEINYLELYDEVLTEWKASLQRHINDEYRENESFDFGFYGGYAESPKTYYALYDIDGNGTKELLLKKQSDYEDIIAYIFVITDGKPINLFGYDDYGVPKEVPWSRVGSCKILANGLIDCRSGNYTIYKIAADGYSVIRLASSSPYDYPDEASKAMAKWKYYVNENEVDSDYYVQFLSEQGYLLDENNALADIEWIAID